MSPFKFRLYFRFLRPAKSWIRDYNYGRSLEYWRIVYGSSLFHQRVFKLLSPIPSHPILEQKRDLFKKRNPPPRFLTCLPVQWFPGGFTPFTPTRQLQSTSESFDETQMIFLPRGAGNRGLFVQSFHLHWSVMQIIWCDPVLGCEC